MHLSGQFLSSTTLASSLYLLLVRCLTCQYAKAFVAIDACSTDIPMNAEERQIWLAIANLGSDPHPDACACRLKLSIVSVGNTIMECAWHVNTELDKYIRLRKPSGVGAHH